MRRMQHAGGMEVKEESGNLRLFAEQHQSRQVTPDDKKCTWRGGGDGSSLPRVRRFDFLLQGNVFCVQAAVDFWKFFLQILFASNKLGYSLQKHLRRNNLYPFLMVSAHPRIDKKQLRFRMLFFELPEPFEIFTPDAS